MTTPEITVTAEQAAIGDADDAHFHLDRALSLLSAARDDIGLAEWRQGQPDEAYTQHAHQLIDKLADIVQERLHELHEILDTVEPEEALPATTPTPGPTLVH